MLSEDTTCQDLVGEIRRVAKDHRPIWPRTYHRSVCIGGRFVDMGNDLSERDLLHWRQRERTGDTE